RAADRQPRSAGPDLPLSHRSPAHRRTSARADRLRLGVATGYGRFRSQRGGRMSDELLPYYERELSFIRRLGAQFARDHPKIAGRLSLGEGGESKDPHVERMIEAFAYLNARTRHKLEDEFPELTEALLGVLYPHYQAPIPSLAIAQFELDPEQKQLTAGHTIARHTALESESIDGEPCRFQTGYPVTLWPITMQSATLSKPPFVAPMTPHSSQAEAVLRVVLA